MEKTSTRWWDVPSAFFLLVLVLLSSWRLEATSWTDGLNHVRNTALLGLAIGLALGQSRFQRWPILFLSIAYMLVVLIWQWLGFIKFSREETYIGDRLMILFGRLWVSFGDYVAGRPVTEPLLFIALLSFPYYLAGLYSGYQLVRYGAALAAILPGGVLMFFVHLNHYTQTDYTWMFAIYFFMALLLMSHRTFLADRVWRLKERVMLSRDSRMDLNNAAIIAAAVLITLAWVAPLSAQAMDRWKTWFGEQNQQEVFTFLNREPQPAAPADFLQTELALGTEASQGDAVEFLVYAPAVAQNIPRLYWRGYVYNHFEDERWQNENTERTNFDPRDGEFDIPTWSQRRNLTFTFDLYEKNQFTLHTPAQPLWVNHGAEVLYAETSPQEEILDIFTLRARPMLNAGEQYRVTALLASPTTAELREAGEEYPSWVIENYLQLPSDFSPRIQALAVDITASHTTPYDKTLAITEYLRREIEYTSTISFPEGTTDQLEYFLFEGKQGFCNYYASAQVLMLRSIGIPARLAVGFAQGEASPSPLPQTTLYTVRERDAHAWPEVYFPMYGWVEFEPTGNQDTLARPEDRQQNTPPTPVVEQDDSEFLLDGGIEEPDSAQQDEQVSTWISQEQIRQIVIGAGFVLLAWAVLAARKRYALEFRMAAAIKAGIERSGWTPPAWLHRWLLWETAPPIERYFHAINLSLRWMGRPQAAHSTPTERANLMKKLVPNAAENIEVVLNELQAELFSSRGGNIAAARRAAWVILFKSVYARLRIIILGYN